MGENGNRDETVKEQEARSDVLRLEHRKRKAVDHKRLRKPHPPVRLLHWWKPVDRLSHQVEIEVFFILKSLQHTLHFLPSDECSLRQVRCQANRYIERCSSESEIPSAEPPAEPHAIVNRSPPSRSLIDLRLERFPLLNTKAGIYWPCEQQSMSMGWKEINRKKRGRKSSDQLRTQEANHAVFG